MLSNLLLRDDNRMTEGAAKNFTTTTAKEAIYAFVFGQKGLMAGIGLQGSMISKITPK